MALLFRPPSPTWEPAAPPDLPQATLWAWVRPASAPLDVIVRIPPPVVASLGPYLTLRRILTALGGQPADIESWNIGGMLLASGGAEVPALDQPLPLSPQHPDPTVILRLRAFAPNYAPVPSPAFAPMPIPAPMAAPVFPTTSNQQTVPAGSDLERTFQAIESDWQAIELLESQLAGIRKQLGSQQGRLQSLNRDLSAEERLAADNNDKKEWQDARRWLRDGAGQVARYIREHDIGVTSAAGRRTQIVQSYEEIVLPRKASPQLAVIRSEIETYRKTCQTLLLAMQNASASASRDGENRAQQILSRIAAKVRSTRRK
ncbi:hypothetical protein [Planctomyces sp. SH-PL14]|uniref:hypothetical protein n=1 Tax=Planctomyces sp. SH-PL14 TaxID=1632864 RepID=UPI00078E284E|nr:hypothetical protein [Planctomyces sp. SH-PL14]AMV19026.1 hypothetical protein VT03_14140 [Planctomyces sp. SH-PL14]